ncbi:MAG: GntR family transcriptional regulator [Anaerolineales bacterium]|jgi:GntR family transcriptional regulator
MQIKLDFQSGVPIYIQIIDQIKHLIAIGILRPDDQLPTVRQVAGDLRVNFNTVARAYRLLDEAGVISTQQGRGTYILAPPAEQASERLRQEALAGLTRRYMAEVAKLGFTPEEINPYLTTLIEEWEKTGSLPDVDFE